MPLLYGIHDLRNDPENTCRRVAVQEIYLHPAYETGLDPNIDGDIALLRLAEPVYDIPVLPLVHQFDLIQPGCRWDRDRLGIDE